MRVCHFCLDVRLEVRSLLVRYLQSNIPSSRGECAMERQTAAGEAALSVICCSVNWSWSFSVCLIICVKKKLLLWMWINIWYWLDKFHCHSFKWKNKSHNNFKFSWPTVFLALCYQLISGQIYSFSQLSFYLTVSWLLQGMSFLEFPTQRF